MLCCYGTRPSKESSSTSILSRRMQLCCVWTNRVYSWRCFLWKKSTDHFQFSRFQPPTTFFFAVSLKQKAAAWRPRLGPVDRGHHLCLGVRSISDQFQFKELNFQLSEGRPELRSGWRSFSGKTSGFQNQMDKRLLFFGGEFVCSFLVSAAQWCLPNPSLRLYNVYSFFFSNLCHHCQPPALIGLLRNPLNKHYNMNGS